MNAEQKTKKTDTSNESNVEQFFNLYITPLKFNRSPLKKGGWKLEDYFPTGKTTFQVRAVKLREGKYSFWTFATFTSSALTSQG